MGSSLSADQQSRLDGIDMPLSNTFFPEQYYDNDFLQRTILLANQLSHHQNSIQPPPLRGLRLSFKHSQMFAFNSVYPVSLVVISILHPVLPVSARLASPKGFLVLYHHILYPLYVQWKSQPSPLLIDICPICMDRETNTVLPCSHAFCKICELEWLEIQNTCPICRTCLNDADDWVLSPHDDKEEFATSAEELALTLFQFLLSLPMEMELGMPSTTVPCPSDLLCVKWLESHVQANAEKSLSFGTCPYCNAMIRIPIYYASAQEVLLCSACRNLQPISQLLHV